MNYFLVLNFLFCLDNCGVSIYWYIVLDYFKGWSVCMLFFGWFNDMYFDWFVVVEMFKVMLGFEKVYIFNVI